MFRIIRTTIITVALLFSLQATAAVLVGNVRGNVTLIEVFDYQCLHCHQAFPVLEKLIDKNPNLKVRLMPVAIINQLSIYEAAAAIASTKYNGKFQEFTNLIMSQPILNKKGIDNALKQLGLTSPDFVKSMHSKFVESQITEGLKYLKAEKAGTPLFVIYPSNNPKVSAVFTGYRTYSVLQQAINEAGRSK